ncbi:MAG: LPS export ABC transporter permease LptF [Candidatus Arsenophonus melophagi]|nr:LPS export ABC transporter permease LptF [Candidatus Arsenophonus melophagi]
MIIIRYLVKEILKSQIAILGILILIFFSQKIIGILNSAAQGNIPSHLVFPLLWLGIPEMAQWIFPLSVFLGILMTYSKLYINSEITVMYACGFTNQVLVIAALILAACTAIMATINVAWILPLSAKYQEQSLADAKANLSLVSMIEGQFKTTKDQNIVLYISDVKGKNFTDIFMAQLRQINNQRPSVVIAEKGRIQEDQNGNQIVILDKGTRYEGTALFRNFRITDFKDYQAVIDHKETVVTADKIEQKDLLQLWHASDAEAKAELHWRLTVVVSALIMALIGVPLSAVNPRHGRVLSMIPAMLLYLFFFLLQSTVHAHAKMDEINPRITMWLVNVAFLLLALILNLWDTVFMHRLRANFFIKESP